MILNANQYVQLDSLFTALAHPKRRGIVYDLALNPATISQLAKSHNLSLPAIHKHLKVLESADLIVRRKSGRTHFLTLKTDSLVLAKGWLGQFRTEWGSESATLDNYIARMKE